MATNFTTADLPKPVLVQPLDYEQIFQLRLNDLVERMRAAGVDYDVPTLQTDPAVIAAQAAAYGDLYYLARLNDAARRILLASFAEGTDLDLHAVRAGLTRASGESDEALRERIRLAYKGKSAAGPDDYYRSEARNADPRVIDVAVKAETRNASERVLILSILTSDNGGLATPDLLAKLTTILNRPDFRQRNVAVEVVPAVIVTKPVQAVIYLYPQAIQPADGGAALRAAFKADQRLGFDLTRSYVEKYLHTTGVQRVELVGWTDAMADFDQAIALGAISIEYRRVDL